MILTKGLFERRFIAALRLKFDSPKLKKTIHSAKCI